MTNGLGRGLSSLIPPKRNQFSDAMQVQGSAPELQQSAGTAILELPLVKIDANPQQPRTNFDERSLTELAESIREYGLLEPIVVTPMGDRWMIVAGERRFRSFQKLGKQTIPAIVRTTSDLERLELALIENIQREDLNPVERASAYARLIDEFGLTQQEAARKLGIARSSLANTVRLLELPSEIQMGLAEGRISEGHAKVLLGLASPREQMAYYQKMLSGKTSVRELSDAVGAAGKKKSGKRSIVDLEIASVEDALQGALGTKVAVKKKTAGGYQIVIDTYSPEEFKSVVRKIKR